MVPYSRQTSRSATLSWVREAFRRPEAGGSRLPKDPTRQNGSLKTAWNNVREKAGVSVRWHDNRDTLITELAENGAGDEAKGGSDPDLCFIPRVSSESKPLTTRTDRYEDAPSPIHTGVRISTSISQWITTVELKSI